MGEKPYHDRETLVRLYHDEGLSTKAIGERFGVSSYPIKQALDDLDVDTQRPRAQDVVQDIQRVADGETPPIQATYRKQGDYGVTTAQRRFGSWNEAIAAAGFEPCRGSNPISEADLLDALADLADELDETPTQNQVGERCAYSVGAYYNHFGSLNAAKEQLGLQLNKQNNAPRVQVECAGPDCTTTVEKTERAIELSEHHYCSQDCLNEHKRVRYAGDGNPRWNKKPVECEHCGETLYKADWERERHEYFYCDDCWGNVTVEITCEWCGGKKEVWPSHDHDDRRYCSIDCLGQWMSDNLTGEDHPRWQPGEKPEYYGPNWRKNRRRALERDQYRCQHCGITQPEHVVEYGESLTVHHLEPIRTYATDNEWDYEQANRLENLQTLCRSCHITAEAMLKE